MIIAILTVATFLFVVAFIFEDDILEARTDEDKKKAERQAKIDDLLGRNKE